MGPALLVGSDLRFHSEGKRSTGSHQAEQIWGRHSKKDEVIGDSGEAASRERRLGMSGQILRRIPITLGCEVTDGPQSDVHSQGLHWQV